MASRIFCNSLAVSVLLLTAFEPSIVLAGPVRPGGGSGGGSDDDDDDKNGRGRGRGLPLDSGDFGGRGSGVPPPHVYVVPGGGGPDGFPSGPGGFPSGPGGFPSGPYGLPYDPNQFGSGGLPVLDGEPDPRPTYHEQFGPSGLYPESGIYVPGIGDAFERWRDFFTRLRGLTKEERELFERERRQRSERAQEERRREELDRRAREERERREREEEERRRQEEQERDFMERKKEEEQDKKDKEEQERLDKELSKIESEMMHPTLGPDPTKTVDPEPTTTELSTTTSVTTETETKTSTSLTVDPIPETQTSTGNATADVTKVITKSDTVTLVVTSCDSEGGHVPTTHYPVPTSTVPQANSASFAHPAFGIIVAAAGALLL